MTGAIVQARTDSTRLPGKVLVELAGKPALCRIIERLKWAGELGKIVVATTSRDIDGGIAEISRDMGAGVFTGSLDDVLDRYYRAAASFGLETVVRITGDCPLVDPTIVDKAVRLYISRGYDYVSTAYPVASFPDGLDVEVFSFDALEKAWSRAKLPSEREHVTPYIWKNANCEFNLGILTNDTDLSAKRWTLDYPEDLKLISAIYDGLYHDNPCFGMQDVLEFLREHPELEAINAKIGRNEGYIKSLARDNERS